MADRLITMERGYSFNCKSVEKRMNYSVGLKKASCMLTFCNVCKKTQRGTCVFCHHCLNMRPQTITQRLKGCKQPTCCANNQNWEKNKTIYEEKSYEELSKLCCPHCRITSANMFYSETPVTQIMRLINLEMDDHIKISKRSEILKHIGECYRNNSISPIVCHNNVYGFGELGEIQIAKELATVFREVSSMKSIRNSLEKVVNNLIRDDSIEKKLYFSSMFYSFHFQ